MGGSKTASSRWHPVFGQRLGSFVGGHRQAWDVVMAFLTVVYVFLGFFEEPNGWNAAEVVVWSLAGVFLLEFLLRFLDDPRPHIYLRDHWIDLVTSIPAVGPLRLLRLLRLLRVFNSARAIKKLAADRGDASTTAGLRFLATTVFAFWLLAGYAFYVTELNQPRTMVHSFTDALFLAFTTSTTVGFSPMKAVTPEGQIVAGLVIFVGLGLLTAASSRLTALWVDATSEQAQNDLLLDIRDQLRTTESRLAAIEAVVGTRKAGSPSPTLPMTEGRESERPASA
ncbi:MAG TPA: potassium channel family protein [Candidatus Dormibacteraeota bacterium]|nr:potassium channel family protein [Candidatus Dormibacteraeota bacterium]